MKRVAFWLAQNRYNWVDCLMTAVVMTNMLHAEWLRAMAALVIGLVASFMVERYAGLS